ncbi:uncharacterized protein J7T54_003832 [Emericellopsis cladophorae]|uniref:CENP-T/Histone H4 histone fold domain-containing protein n=1 Tax=Emericellopsis cladophorae TaxID=2686198 RepID=A0A9Q0BBQ0_9HYPO|nr:uncharacterized protein J7T54_003832 [Emericellopsis cladophorae]KAI6778896.1 hypothetical protein J7T54_003832 [Emericellopsis cladophorae]
MSTPSAHRTPSRSEPPPSAHSVHTPLDRTGAQGAPNSVRRGTSQQPPSRNAPTPHGRAARRQLMDRRTAIFTPGKKRRKSQNDQREDAMDILRHLGKALAPNSQVIHSSSSMDSSDGSPESTGKKRKSSKKKPRLSVWEEDDGLDDNFPLDRPRFSLPIDQDEDEEEDLPPPRLSENYTVQSVEMPRRADPDRDQARLSMLGGRMSDVFGTLPPEEGGEGQRESDFFDEGLYENLMNRPADDEYNRIDDDTLRRETMGGDDFQMGTPGGIDEPSTFAMSPPIIPDPELTAPILEEATGGLELDAGSDPEPAPFEDFDDGQPFEDIPGGSDEEGIPMDDAPSDRGGSVEPTNDLTENITAPQVGQGRDAMPARKKTRISRHGLEYPSLPPAFVKKVAQRALQSSGLSNPRLSTDTLDALTQASEWFFEQLGDDLGAYASHAKRKTVEESDVVTLMRR